MAVTVSARNRFGGPSAATLIRIAAVSAALGIALSITEDYTELGKWCAVLGVLLLVVGLHRFGRLGPDAEIHFESARSLRHKRKRRATSTDDRPS